MSQRTLLISQDCAHALGATLVHGTFCGASGVSIDSRTLKPGDLFVAIHGRRFDGHDFVSQALVEGAVGAVVDRWPVEGFSERTPGCVWRVPDTLRALGDLARFHRQRFKVDLIAVTGSSGKTTTKSILAHLLSDREPLLVTPGTQNNLIGVPLTLLRLSPKHRRVILEFGTNRWGEIRRLTEIAQPTIGVITNIGPAHLETFGDLKGVLRAKAEMCEVLDPKGTLVLCADDPLLWEAGKKLPHRVIWFSTQRQAQIRASQIQMEAWGSRCLVNDRLALTLPLPGRHNLMNALAALAVVQALEEDLSEAVERLGSIQPVAGRLVQRQWEECLVIDDTYNSNPASLRAALEVLQGIQSSGRRIAVLGDMLELGEQAESFHAEAGRWVAQEKIDFLLTVGPLSRRLGLCALEAGFPRETTFSFETSEEAGEFLLRLVHPGDLILVKGSRAIQMERILTCSTTSSIR